jgi:2-keto-3-deoxy-L-rhamnonate aldolase RhmA
MFDAIRKFREKMNSGGVCLGAGISLTDSAVVEALAPAIDFVWIDLEHTHLSYESVHNHLIAARAGNVAALVRVRGSDVPHIKPILDIGASGIIVPQVRSAEEVQAVVDACRYAPRGNRGFGPRRASGYGRDSGVAWMQSTNADLFVAVQIENSQALEALDEIVQIEGLDSIALGPYDLSISLGHPGDFSHPTVTGALDTIVTKARAAGKYVGTGMGAYAGNAIEAVTRGVQWIQCGDDYGYMVAYADNLMNEIRKSAAPHSKQS